MLTLAIVGVNGAVGTIDPRGKVADIGSGDVGHKDVVILPQDKARKRG